MTGHWMTQTAAAIVGVHLLIVAAVAAVLVALVLPALRRRHIRRSQVLTTRIALAGLAPVVRPHLPRGRPVHGRSRYPRPCSVRGDHQVPRVVRRRPSPDGGVMDIVCGVVAGALIGIPWAYSQLHQSTATPRGWHWISAPSRDVLTGQAREVGTPDLPLGACPPHSTDHARSVS